MLIGFTILMSALTLAPDIAAIVILQEDGDNPCQGKDPTGLSLKDWLIASVIVNFVGAVIDVIMMIFAIASSSLAECALAMAALSVPFELFNFAWTIVGIVILSRSHGDCLADGEAIGIMVLIKLALYVIHLLWVCWNKRKKSANTNNDRQDRNQDTRPSMFYYQFPYVSRPSSFNRDFPSMV